MWFGNFRRLLPGAVRWVSYLVIFWLVFLLGRTVWQNWYLKQNIEKLNWQIATLEKEKKDYRNLLTYYQSDSFRELEARKRLGLKKPGEKVVILPTSTPTAPVNFPNEIEQEKNRLAIPSPALTIPNWQLWWQYFTK